MSDSMSIVLSNLKVVNFKIERTKEKQLDDFEYLLHHIAINEETGDEEVHHCYIFDHKANLFEQGHLEIRDDKAFVNGKRIKKGHFHVIIGLEPTQEVAWSDADAKAVKIKPKHPRPGMTFKEKAKEW